MSTFNFIFLQFVLPLIGGLFLRVVWKLEESIKGKVLFSLLVLLIFAVIPTGALLLISRLIPESTPEPLDYCLFMDMLWRGLKQAVA